LAARDGINGDSLLSQTKEQFAPVPGFSTIEAESKLIKIADQMLMAEGSPMSLDQPPLEQGDHEMNRGSGSEAAAVLPL
jgi:hypothetical protein